MRSPLILALASTLAALVPTRASAEPELRWVNDWQYTSSSTDDFGTASFGSTTADSATGGIRFSPPFETPFGGASTSVTFSRMFELSGDPQGWDVEFFYDVMGPYNSLHAVTIDEFSAKIEGTRIEGSSSSILGPPVGSVGIFGYGIHDHFTDGIYTISGTHRVWLESVRPGGGIFVNVNDTFSLRLHATPLAVPEPGSVALLGLGGLGAWLVLGRRRNHAHPAPRT